jgi:hypothetical protein
MKTSIKPVAAAADLLSLRAASREFHVDRATLARLVAERGVPQAGERAGHPVFDREDLRRAVGLEYYGSAAAIIPTCGECWGPLAHHRGGKPCKPGSYERYPERYGAAP